METNPANDNLHYHLSIKAQRSFLVSSPETSKNPDLINSLVSSIDQFFISKNFSSAEIISHIFLIQHNENKKEKIKLAIKKFEANLHKKPRKGLLNVGIIDFDYILKTSNEYHRLLKILEEPPQNSQIYVLSSNLKAIPKTILSRLLVIKDSRKLDLTLNKTSLLDINDTLLDCSKKLNNLTGNELKSLLAEVLNLNKLKEMNYNQIRYIQNLIDNVTRYKKLNLKPLDTEINVLRKLNKEKVQR